MSPEELEIYLERAGREAEIWEDLFKEVYAAITAVPYVDYGECDDWGMAEAAVNVLREFYRSGRLP